MRVLSVIDSLAPGGAERSLVDLARHLPDAGVAMTIATLYDRAGFTSELAAIGVPHHQLPDGLRARVAALADLVRHERPDVLHTTLYEADVAGRLVGVRTRLPVVCSLTSTRYTAEQFAEPSVSAPKLRAAQAIDIVTARAVTRFHAVSDPVADAMASALRVGRAKIEVVERGRDQSTLGRRSPERRRAARAALGLADTDPLLLAVARHERAKGLDVLLDAMPAVLDAHPSARLVVAGTQGRVTSELEDRRQQRGLEASVTFLGRRDDVPDLLVAADVFVLPSRREGFPGAVVEAMALEAPVVATDIATVRAVVPDARYAALVPPDRADLLAAAVIATLGELAVSKARTDASRLRFAELFTIERSAQRMAELFRAVARPSPTDR